MLNPDTKSGRYIGIKSDGKFHEKVDEGTEGAVLRKYELKDGTKGEKWELIYRSIGPARITNIEFETGDFGDNIVTTFKDGDEEVKWSEGTNTNFGTDYMKKLPNVDFSLPLTISPYAFEDERGKEKRGVTINQNGDKVQGYFWDEQAERPDGKKGAPSNGFPEPEGDRETYDSDDWKVYFIGVRKFLVAFTKANVVPAVLEAEPAEVAAVHSEAVVRREKIELPSIADMPFGEDEPVIDAEA